MNSLNILWEIALKATTVPYQPAFPVWGTCAGFQLLGVLAAGGNKSVLAGAIFDSEDYMADLTLTGEESRMFAAMPADVKATLLHGNATLNAHHDGIFPETMVSNQRLGSFFRSTDTSVDRKGLEFVSVMEARNLP